MSYPKLIFDQIETNAPYHAAHSAFRGESGTSMAKHNHDYFECIVVIDGQAPHWINESCCPLKERTLTLVRPDDTHAILPTGADSIEIINIAFPCRIWEDFIIAAGLLDAANVWLNSAFSISVGLLEDQASILLTDAFGALLNYQKRPTRLALTPFLCTAAKMLSESGHNFGAKAAQPTWLGAALRWAENVDPFDLTLECLIERAGVSGAHLSRCMKASTGITPTEFINELRIKRAAYEIGTSSKPITDIAYDCGFASLSYFYRRFVRAYGKTPNQYRCQPYNLRD